MDYRCHPVHKKEKQRNKTINHHIATSIDYRIKLTNIASTVAVDFQVDGANLAFGNTWLAFFNIAVSRNTLGMSNAVQSDGLQRSWHLLFILILFRRSPAGENEAAVWCQLELCASNADWLNVVSEFDQVLEEQNSDVVVEWHRCVEVVVDEDTADSLDSAASVAVGRTTAGQQTYMEFFFGYQAGSGDGMTTGQNGGRAKMLIFGLDRALPWELLDGHFLTTRDALGKWN